MIPGLEERLMAEGGDEEVMATAELVHSFPHNIPSYFHRF
jgi:hypothetical protein